MTYLREVISNFDFLENPPKLQHGKLVVAFPSVYMFDQFYSHGKVLAEILASSHNMRPFIRVWGADVYPDIPLQHTAPDQIDYIEINGNGIATLSDFESRLNVNLIPHHTKNCYAEFLT